MLRIKKRYFDDSKIDFELENGILLYTEDWNGKFYIRGFDLIGKKYWNFDFNPVYKDSEIIGFKE